MTGNAHVPASMTPSNQRKQALTRRLIVWSACLLTYGITLVLLRSIKTATGLDPFSILIQGFLPIGAVCVAGLAVSGFMLGAAYVKLRADRWDLLFLLLACFLLNFIIVAVDYRLLLAAQPELAAHLSYGRYFALALTTPEYLTSSSHFGAAPPHPIGEPGWLLLLPRLGCLLGVAKLVHSRYDAGPSYAV